MISRKLLRSAALAAAAATSTGAVAAEQPAQTMSMISAASAVTGSTQVLRQAQAALKSAGLYRGAIDGIIGPETEDALKKYQQRAGLPPNGRLDQTTLSRLLTAAAAVAPTPEAGTPAARGSMPAAAGSSIPASGNAAERPSSGSPPSGTSQSGASQSGASQSGTSQSGASQSGASQSGASQSGASQSGAPAQPSTSAGGTQSEPGPGGGLLSLSPQRVPPYPDNPRTERGLVRATEITAQKLYSKNGGTFAQIEDLLIDPANARVTGVIVDRQDASGNYTGERLVVPVGDIKLTKGGWIITNLAAAPQP